MWCTNKSSYVMMLYLRLAWKQMRIVKHISFIILRNILVFNQCSTTDPGYVIWQQFSLQMIFFHLNKSRRRHSSKDQNDQIEAGSHHRDLKQLSLPQCLDLFHRTLPDRPLLPPVTDPLSSCTVVGTPSCKLGAKELTTSTVQLMLVWCSVLLAYFFLSWTS